MAISAVEDKVRRAAALAKNFRLEKELISNLESRAEAEVEAEFVRKIASVRHLRRGGGGWVERDSYGGG